MRRFVKRTSKKAGLPPGTLVHIGERKIAQAKITVVDYDDTRFQEKEVKTIGECLSFKDKPTVTWINIDGIHQVEIIEELGKSFGVHPLLLEDIMHTEQRPKLEDYGDYVFIVLKMLHYNEKKNEIDSEQVSLILGPHFVISFKESQSDAFDPIRERLRNQKGRVRKMGTDYLAYTLIDAIVDNYFVILEKLGEQVEGLEEELVTKPTSKTLQAIHTLKKEMIFLRKSVWPLREVVSGMERGESPLIHEATGIYLRDVYDHTIQVIDTIETFRDMISGMLDIYLSSISNAMNAVMKVLTIIATIFIPLTFIAGIYGMNFKYMPELEWRWGYFIVWAIMIVIGFAMVLYFKRKKWL
jgi:magnesium transporter